MTVKRPARRSERSRQAILSAATELVAEVGFPKLTIEAIAARAGVGKQTIYRWWPSKGAVVFDAMLSQMAEDGDLSLPDSGDLATDLRLLLRQTVAEMGAPGFQASGRAMTTEIQSDPALATEYRERLLGPNLEATKRRLRSAQEAGQVAADVDLDVAVELLFGPIYYRWLLRLGPLDDDYADKVTDFALSALR
ncbi:TetR/AcrR family transcriptional regulator [Phytomonospora sp. NPDC050363]|uniref:TetR/AcrR family transcriptional regulator n=1 Tax=Phytomonospora sp. NPDC050363 TaxID=3155642 RepID=UPI00340A7033